MRDNTKNKISINQKERGLDLNAEEIKRYARHISLPEIGLNGQRKLKGSSVLCVGIGGLGSPILLYLAAAGVGRIGLVDFDVVEASNLQRQVIHGHAMLGNAKTVSARSRIHDINPSCQVDIYEEELTNENAFTIIKPYDVICDCCDNFPTRYLLSDACVLLNKVHVYGSIHQFEGQASVFNLHENSPTYRDLIPVPPPLELTPSCSEDGVLGVLPGLIGIIQATETIKIITGVGEPLDGRLLVFNALTMNFKELRLLKSKNNKKVESLIDYKLFCGDKSNQINQEVKDEILQISANELKVIIESKEYKFSLIDVRNQHEANEKSIAGSKLIPLDTIKNGESIKYIKNIASKQKIFIYCKSGSRSVKALKILKTFGIIGTNIIGGIDAWEGEVIQNKLEN